MNDPTNILLIGLLITWIGGLYTGHAFTALYYRIYIKNLLDRLLKATVTKVSVSDLYPKKDYRDESNE